MVENRLGSPCGRVGWGCLLGRLKTGVFETFSLMFLVCRKKHFHLRQGQNPYIGDGHPTPGVGNSWKVL